MQNYERIGKFIYAFHRMCGRPLEDLAADALPEGVTPELAARAASLAQRFNLLAKDFAAATDEDFAATLEEASAVRTLIDNADPKHGI